MTAALNGGGLRCSVCSAVGFFPHLRDGRSCSALCRKCGKVTRHDPRNLDDEHESALRRERGRAQLISMAALADAEQLEELCRQAIGLGLSSGPAASAREESSGPLPCPFCGHAASIERGDGYVAFACGNEACPCEESAVATGDDEPHALRLWNTRTTPGAT